MPYMMANAQIAAKFLAVSQKMNWTQPDMRKTRI
jgi:hypothetical protein